MFNFSHLLLESPPFIQLEKDVRGDALPANVVGLSPIHKAHWILSLQSRLRRPVLVLVPDEAHVSRLCGDINAMAGRELALPFGARDYTFRPVEGVSREYEFGRISTLSRLMEHPGHIVVASAEGATQFTLPPQELRDNSFALAPGDTHDLTALIQRLVRASYVRREQIGGVAEFSVRGGLLDIFPPNEKLPVRLEFWGDEIDSINTFDLVSQRRLEWVERVLIGPTTEVLAPNPVEMGKVLQKKLNALRSKNADQIRENFSRDLELLTGGEVPAAMDRYIPMLYSRPATILEYFKDIQAAGRKPIFIVSEIVNIQESLKNQAFTHNEDIKTLYDEGMLFRGLDRYYADYTDILAATETLGTVCLDTFARTAEGVRFRDLINAQAINLSSWSGEYAALKDDLDSLLHRQHPYKVVVLAGTDKAAKNVASDLLADNIPVVYGGEQEESKAAYGQVLVLAGSLSAGMDYPDARVAVISHSRQHSSAAKKKKSKSKNAIRNLSDLTIGDYVVHTAHGIGVFEGIHKIETQGIVKDYIKIRYAGADVLYVPVTQLDLVSKYIGPRENDSLRLNKLNSGQWEKTRSRVRKAVADMAKELIELYAKRMKMKGHAFSADTDWQAEFEERFEHQETDDQLTSIAEIKRDMESAVPMDRLLCGDVGFGKTEVALRAAFKCIMDGKQCAILVPTTILAWQHYKTITRRFEGYPINIALMSRFRTAKQQAETVKGLRRGEVDIVVGTHRLVQKDIKFKDLGLAIIDEEQRFGVKHKEQFKEATTNVDVLTLSATPIPRTLNMAMSGIRDMSAIDEAPQDRHPVQTYVLEHNNGVIAEAIKRELRRDGQVYYIHNRIESIERTAARLQKALPDARVAFAHGRMAEEELSQVWRRLIDHEVDVLVCTTIIETGVDVPNVNTLVIEDADYMGLSQLYQIRGRVGRSSRRAFAYFTFRRGKIVSDIAAKRLSAIREFTNFGSGFQIAMRDLEIRGAGNILGAQQHGHMEAVGYDMYLKLLSEAIAEEKGEAPQGAKECLVDIRIDAHIPENYIPGLTQRIDIYRRIAGVTTKEDVMDVTDELIDRFGDPPDAVKGLVEVALLRNTAAQAGIGEITQSGSSLLFYQDPFDMSIIARLNAALKGRVMVNAGERPYFSVRIPKNTSPVNTMREALEALTADRGESA